jgi:hypothetical protein
VHGAWGASMVYVWVVPHNLKPSLRERNSLPAHCVLGLPAASCKEMQLRVAACCCVSSPNALEAAATRELSAHAHHPSLSRWLGSVAICVTGENGVAPPSTSYVRRSGVWHCGVGRWFGGVMRPLSGTILGFAAGQSEADTLADRRDSGTYCSLATPTRRSHWNLQYYDIIVRKPDGKKYPRTKSTSPGL